MTKLDSTPIVRRPTRATTRLPAVAGASMGERMLTLTYRTARQLGYSPRASHRLCSRVLLRARVTTSDHGQNTDTGRATRARVVTALRALLEPNIDQARLREALQTAVFWDEATRLPRRQQRLILLTLTQRCTLAQLVEQTGWTPDQVTRLLRAGLRTITVCGDIGNI
jgi:hypothetical protein